MEEFVAMVLADQTTRVSDMFEHVCHQYRMIDEQVEADRKRRRNEVNIAAGALDSELGQKLAKKYTDIVAKILEGSGVLHYYPWVVKLLQQGPGAGWQCNHLYPNSWVFTYRGGEWY